MSDTFGEIFAVILCIILMGVCPVTLMNLRHGSNMAYEAMNIASGLSEQLIQNGYITYESYKEVNERLAILGGYRLEILHERRLSEGYSVDGLYTEVAGGYFGVTTEEIEAVLIRDGRYDMYIGDRVKVRVSKDRYDMRFGGLVLNEAY